MAGTKVPAIKFLKYIWGCLGCFGEHDVIWIEAIASDICLVGIILNVVYNVYLAVCELGPACVAQIRGGIAVVIQRHDPYSLSSPVCTGQGCFSKESGKYILRSTGDETVGNHNSAVLQKACHRTVAAVYRGGVNRRPGLTVII